LTLGGDGFATRRLDCRDDAARRRSVRALLVALYPYPSPFTAHRTFFTVYLPYTLHPSPYTVHRSPFTLHPTPYTVHPSP